jgi:hypothetical protein
MYTCTICRFDCPLDDVAVPAHDSRCICLACYGRLTETAKLLSKALRRELIATLAQQEAA